MPDLIKANFTMHYFQGAILKRANLQHANLEGVDLQAANLYRAYLVRANLEGANLRRADLSEVNLVQAVLTQADLRGADFKNAVFRATIFVNVDLSDTKGLENVTHLGPSSIGIDTLYKSKGKIPEVFLRGCGVPDQMIEYANSLKNSSIRYYSCFISYSNEDERFARRVHNDLQAAGVRCWYAPHDMKIGDKIRPTIDESIRVHDKLLIILSRHSVGSEWVKDEVEHAIDLEKERKQSILFPVRIDDAVMESETGWAGNVRRQRHIGDFTRWKDHDAYSKAFDRLLEDLKAG